MIRVGVKVGSSIEWRDAHSMCRNSDGSFVVYGLDDNRTPWTLKAKDFAGVLPSA